MTDIQVVYGSKMGGTRGIAEELTDEMVRAGLTVDLVDASASPDAVPAKAAAVVVGSAVYAGRWRPEVVDYLNRNVGELVNLPVWMFHSGPCGVHAATTIVPVPAKVRRLAEQIRSHAPVTFGGRLEPETAVGFLARRMAKGPMAGDFRDMEAVRALARSVAEELSTSPA